MKPIYKPKGAAKEYGDYAINIYTGCPHRCYYCFAPQVLRRDREAFHSCVEPRKNIVEEVKKQLQQEQITGRLIHLCFACDPYPTGYDTTPTREIIKALKERGNHVQILTKGDGSRDFDLLDGEDWYGVTISCGDDTSRDAEPVGVLPTYRLRSLLDAKKHGAHTWVSFEPVLEAGWVLDAITMSTEFADRVKIGKLNYHPSDIDWAKFGRDAEELCRKLGLDYYIKDSLRAEMEGGKMREILFRGKRVDNGEWVYGAGPLEVCPGKWATMYTPEELCYVKPETIGQYTGLNDKNGVKIFEGDIVHAVHRSGYGGLRDTDFGNGIVEYHGDYYGGAAWMMNTIGHDGSRAFSASVECEVIGNVWDNPELLEGEDEWTAK